MAGAAHVAKTHTGANAYFNERLLASVPHSISLCGGEEDRGYRGGRAMAASCWISGGCELLVTLNTGPHSPP